MPIVQISRIQHRRGKATDLPQLAAGEIGWSVDDQKLYIGNGTVADGAPAVGNTEIITSGSSAFSTALTHVYKGYLGASTPVITGATGGIGHALVKKFVSLEGDVLATGTKIEKLDVLKREFPKINILKFDISNHSKIEEFIENVSSQLIGLDILINNAGINMDNLSLRMKDEEWKKVIDVNLGSTFFLCKYAIKKMLKNKYGRIVNITSVVGHTGNLGQSNYAASKAAIIGMSKSLAIEYAKKNITINCVSPGFIQSSMTDRIVESIKAALTSRIPMSRLGTGEDVSNTVAFLSSESTSYITGETIHVNGGMYMA